MAENFMHLYDFKGVYTTTTAFSQCIEKGVKIAPNGVSNTALLTPLGTLIPLGMLKHMSHTLNSVSDTQCGDTLCTTDTLVFTVWIMLYYRMTY